MSVKEAVINTSIENCLNKLKKLTYLIDLNPVAEIAKIRIEAQRLLKDKPDNWRNEIDSLANDEKRVFRLEKKREKLGGSIGISNKIIELQNELQELQLELLAFNRKKGKANE